MRRLRKLVVAGLGALGVFAGTAGAQDTPPAEGAAKRPNVLVLMTDDTGWNDWGAYLGGGATLGHPTPSIDRLAEEGTLFTSWYGQASCTAGRASLMTGRVPIRSALSVVVVPGDQNGLQAQTPTIAEFFKKSGYKTYFSGKWHLGDKPQFYPIEHGFDEMKHFAAYYPGVYAYNDTSAHMHPWFPSYNAEFAQMYDSAVNLGEWEGVAGQEATRTATIDYDYLAEFDVRQADSAVAWIEAHADDPEPFFMDVNFMKMHNPNNPAEAFRGKSRLGNYSDSMLELDSNIGRVMDAVREHAPNTIVVLTADNGAWQDAWPDAGTTPFRGEKGSAFEGGWRVPAIMWWPDKVPAGEVRGEMMSHIDTWATLAKLVGLEPPPQEWVGDDGAPIYFDSIDNSAYILGEAPHSARTSWIYIDGESFGGMRFDVSGDPADPGLNIAWKYLYTAKDTWLGPEQNLGCCGSVYNLTMDPFEKYDMLFNGAVASRMPTTSPGRYAGEDNGWVAALASAVLLEFNQSIMKFPSIRRVPGGASDDLVPNLQNPEDPVPALDPANPPRVGGMGG
jgi:arylsulfatase A-like enzyme